MKKTIIILFALVSFSYSQSVQPLSPMGLIWVALGKSSNGLSQTTADARYLQKDSTLPVSKLARVNDLLKWGTDSIYSTDYYESGDTIYRRSDNAVVFPNDGGFNTSSGRLAQVISQVNGASVVAVGVSNPTQSGGIAGADDAFGSWQRYFVATPTTGQVAGLVSNNYTQCRGAWSAEATITFQLDTANLTSCRTWIGLVSADPSASSQPNVHFSGIRYATDIDGTPFFRAVSIAGTGTSADTTATNVQAAINTAYTLRIILTATSSKIYLNGNLVATHATNIPTSSTNLGWVCKTTVLADVKRNIRFGRMMLKF